MTARILIIDDDIKLATMVVEYLQGNGLTAEARHDAHSGMTRLDEERFDALVLDVMLPDIDGFEVCRQLRVRTDIPILMLTARGDDTDRIVGLEIGADDYLPKPFNPRELLARLRAVLRRRQPARKESDVLRFGRLEIDIGAREVRLAGEPRLLTSHQFELLLALAHAAGRAMSRDALMNTLRGHELEAFDRSIDVHISRIRAAIEEDPKQPRRIVTLRGVGYMFVRDQEGAG